MFNLTEQPVIAASSKVSGTDENDPVSIPVAKLEPIEKSTNVKIIRKIGSGFTPSIKDALAGNTSEKKADDQVQESTYNEYENFAEPFTNEQLAIKWQEFIASLTDRPNLKATLINIPELTEGNHLLLKIGSSVQEEEVRQVKFELLSWLRKELRNSGIELTTRIEKLESERMFYSDSEKMQIMMQKNPELFQLKQKFNLDFKD
jgi:DNA polymerase-3 subunit gamma/tau